ncbi:MAG: SocA family protein [Pirellulales bacterium]|nr:SocA family protein [Pirellulales bacterium]
MNEQSPHSLREPHKANDKKLRELVLYISDRSEGDRAFGAVKLNKLLFYADFLAYLDLGNAITGHEYQKLEHGPCPRRLKPILDELVKEEDLVVKQRKYHGYTQNVSIAIREPDLSLFDAAEISLVDRLVSDFWGKSARQMSEMSHEFIGWQLAGEGESIPYEVAHLNIVAEDEANVELSESFAKQLSALAEQVKTGT